MSRHALVSVENYRMRGMLTLHETRILRLLVTLPPTRPVRAPTSLFPPSSQEQTPAAPGAATPLAGRAFWCVVYT